MSARPADAANPPPYVERARALAPLIEEAAPRVESARQLDETVVAALHEAGLFRLFMPHWLDGGEMPPSDFVDTIETLARADASTAWCLCQMNVCAISSVYLKPTIAHEIFGRPGAALAWGSTPDAQAVVAPGGYRVTGNWEFGSGCHEASWLGGHCAVVNADGTPRLDDESKPLERTVLFPKTAASISDEWRVIGLRGTGSDMYAVRDLFIPEDYTILALMRWPDATRRRLGLPYRFGASSLYASGFAAVALGNARATLDSFVELAGRKVPRGGRNPLAENAIVQVELAEADTRLEAARVYLVHTLRQVEDAARRRGEVGLDQRMKIRAAGTFAIRVATGVVDRFYEMAGTTAIFEGSAFERRFRDAHTVSQHLQGRISHFETVGKHLLGLETDRRFV